MFSYYSQTDVGLVRPDNEDTLDYDAKAGVVVLADGMGGHNAGEVASRIAVDYLAAALPRWLASHGTPAWPRGALLRQLDTEIQSANRLIRTYAQAHASCEGMGTTLVMGVLNNDYAVIAHAGDSRCYRFRNNVLSALTRDHSIWQGQRDLVGVHHAWRPEYAGVITRALGVEPVVLVDFVAVPVVPGDLFLFCSDGLTDMVSEEQIQMLMMRNRSISELGEELVEHARYNGGRDNISVLLALHESY